MFGECKEYLISQLIESGIKTKVYTSMKKLKASNESHIGAVLFENDKYEKSGAKTFYVDESGVKHKRVKKYVRKISFTVIIGEYDQNKCESIFETFLGRLEQGIVIDGNYTAIEVEEADWFDEDDSILKAKVAVQAKIRFDGGVYRDIALSPVNEFDSTIDRCVTIDM